MKNYADNGDKRAKRALQIAENFDRTLSTILVGNNVVNMASASIATVVATALLGNAYGPAAATIVMTVVVLIFGEILPKTLAKENSEQIALKVSGLLSFLMKLLSPVVWIFIGIKEFALRAFKGGEAQPSVTEEELKYRGCSRSRKATSSARRSSLTRSLCRKFSPPVWTSPRSTSIPPWRKRSRR